MMNKTQEVNHVAIQAGIIIVITLFCSFLGLIIVISGKTGVEFVENSSPVAFLIAFVSLLYEYCYYRTLCKDNPNLEKEKRNLPGCFITATLVNLVLFFMIFLIAFNADDSVYKIEYRKEDAGLYILHGFTIGCILGGVISIFFLRVLKKFGFLEKEE